MMSLKRRILRITGTDEDTIDLVNSAFEMHKDEREALIQTIVFLYKYQQELLASSARVEAKINEVLQVTRNLREASK